MANYKNKLKHPKWQRKRLEIMSRDNFTCQFCGDTETTLHVHHKVYEPGEPWETSDDFLITYCEICNIIVEQVIASGSEEWLIFGIYRETFTDKATYVCAVRVYPDLQDKPFTDQLYIFDEKGTYISTLHAVNFMRFFDSFNIIPCRELEQ